MTSEAHLQAQVLDLAALLGWHRFHGRPVNVNGEHWETPGEGDVEGFPDLILARGGTTLVAELKSEKGRLTAAQRAWLDAAGGVVWRPSDWADIVAALS